MGTYTGPEVKLPAKLEPRWRAARTREEQRIQVVVEKAKLAGTYYGPDREWPADR